MLSVPSGHLPAMVPRLDALAARGCVVRGRDDAGRQRESDAGLAAVGQDFPGWQPWRSSAGRCWAVRLSGARPAARVPVEWARTVSADTPEELRAVLGRQEGLTR
jgi:hypothetical protein